MCLKFLTVLKFQQRLDMETGSKISLDAKDIKNTETLLLCNIQNLQDPTRTWSSWIQDPQGPAESFLSEIPDP